MVLGSVSKGGQGEILLVDDTPEGADWLIEAVKPLGYDIKQATNPMILPLQVRKENPSLVLLELNQPRLQGDRLVQIMREHLGDDVPMMILLANGEGSGLEAVATGCGADGWLSREQNPSTLRRRLEGYLKESQERRNRRSAGAEPAFSGQFASRLALLAGVYPQLTLGHRNALADLQLQARVIHRERDLLDALHNSGARMVLLGEGMRDTTAERMCRAIREDPNCPRTSILVLVPDPGSDLAMRARSAGANGILRWPASVRELADGVGPFQRMAMRRELDVVLHTREQRPDRAGFAAFGHLDRCVDISISGLSFLSSSVHLSGDRVWFNFALPQSKAPIEAEAEVVRRVPKPDGADLFGAKFIGLEEDSRRAIASYVGSAQMGGIGRR